MSVPSVQAGSKCTAACRHLHVFFFHPSQVSSRCWSCVCSMFWNAGHCEMGKYCVMLSGWADSKLCFNASHEKPHECVITRRQRSGQSERLLLWFLLVLIVLFVFLYFFRSMTVDGYCKQGKASCIVHQATPAHHIRRTLHAAAPRFAPDSTANSAIGLLHFRCLMLDWYPVCPVCASCNRAAQRARVDAHHEHKSIFIF